MVLSKPIPIILGVVWLFLLVGSVSAATEYALSDDFDDSSLNATLWTCAAGCAEGSGYLSLTGAGAWNRTLASNWAFNRTDENYTFYGVSYAAAGSQHMYGVYDGSGTSYTDLAYAFYLDATYTGSTQTGLLIYENGSTPATCTTTGNVNVWYEWRIDIQPTQGANYYYRQNNSATWINCHNSTANTISTFYYGAAMNTATSGRLDNASITYEGTPASSYFEITATDLYDSSSITTFYANVTHNGTTGEYGTTNGTINFNFTSGDGLVNATVWADDYFPEVTEGHNTNSTLAATLFQVQVTFTADEIISGDNVDGFTVSTSDNGGSATATDTNPTLYLKAGTYNVTFNKTGWYNKTYQLTFLGQTTVAANNYSCTAGGTGASISNCAQSNDDDWGTSANCVTGSGSCTITVIKNYATQPIGTATLLVGTRSFNLNTTVSYYNSTSGAYQSIGTTTTDSGLNYVNDTFTIPSDALGLFRIVGSANTIGDSSQITETQLTTTGNYTQNLSGVYQYLLNITATNNTGTVTTFSANIDDGTYSQNSSTTNGTLQVPWINASAIIITLNATYNSITNNTADLTSYTPEVTVNISIALLTYNTFNITFYNETTDLQISDTVYLSLISDTFAANYTITNGTGNITFLTPEDYQLIYYYDPDVPRQYFVTLTNNSFSNLRLYTIDEDISQFYLPNIKDPNGFVCEEQTVSLLRYYIDVNGYRTVEMAKTDTQGNAVLRVQPNIINYKFQFQGSCGNFTTQPSKITTSTQAYTVSDAQSPLTAVNGYEGVSKSLTFTNSTNTFVFTWADTNNLVEQGCIYVDKYNSSGLSQVYEQCDAAASGSLIYTVTDTNGTTYTVTGTLDISDATISDTIDHSYRDPTAVFGLTGVFLTLLVVILFLFFGLGSAESVVFSGIFAIFVMGAFGFIFNTYLSLVGIVIVGVIIAYKTVT